MNKITVREICDKDEINRSTFYKHYQDCYDLLDKLKEDALAQFDELLAGIEGHGMESAILAILQALENHAQTFRLLAPDGGGGAFIHQVVRRCYQYMDLHLTVSPAKGWSEIQKGMSYAFLTGGAGSVIEYWMRGGCKELPEDVAAMIMESSKTLAAGLSGKNC